RSGGFSAFSRWWPRLERLERRDLPSGFVVTNTLDAGLGSLRGAITGADANPGLDTITFNIPGAGLQVINLLSALPTISDPVILDGFTQPGAQPNTSTNTDNAV